MASERADQRTESRDVFGFLKTLGVQRIILFLSAILAGYSVTLLSTDSVALPVVGSVSGQLLGAIGIATFAVTYSQVGCSDECGCSGACGDRCSYDP